MPTANTEYNIDALDRINSQTDILNGDLEIFVNGENKKLGAPLLIQTAFANAPAPTQVHSFTARTYDNNAAGYVNGDDTLISICAKFKLVHLMTASVAKPVFKKYRLIADINGGFLAYKDSTYTGNMFACKWVEIDSDEDKLKDFTAFNPSADKYAAGDIVKYLINGKYRLFTTKADILKSTFNPALIPTPSGARSDNYWYLVTDESAPNYSKSGQLETRFYFNSERDSYPADTVEDIIAREIAGAGILYLGRTLTVEAGAAKGNYIVEYDADNTQFTAYSDGSFQQLVPASFKKVAIGTSSGGGSSVTEWVAGKQTRNSIVRYNDELYLVKDNIANSQIAPETNAQYYKPLKLIVEQDLTSNSIANVPSVAAVSNAIAGYVSGADLAKLSVDNSFTANQFIESTRLNRPRVEISNASIKVNDFANTTAVNRIDKSSNKIQNENGYVEQVLEVDGVSRITANMQNATTGNLEIKFTPINGTIDLTSATHVKVAAPIGDADAATKTYVDTAISTKLLPAGTKKSNTYYVQGYGQTDNGEAGNPLRPYNTIQSAVNDAVSGDTIIILAGGDSVDYLGRAAYSQSVNVVKNLNFRFQGGICSGYWVFSTFPGATFDLTINVYDGVWTNGLAIIASNGQNHRYTFSNCSFEDKTSVYELIPNWIDEANSAAGLDVHEFNNCRFNCTNSAGIDGNFKLQSRDDDPNAVPEQNVHVILQDSQLTATETPIFTGYASHSFLAYLRGSTTLKTQNNIPVQRVTRVQSSTVIPDAQLIVDERVNSVGSGGSGGAVSVQRFAEYTASADGAQTITVTASAVIDLAVFEPAGGVRTIYPLDYSFSNNTLTINKEASIRAGDKIAGYALTNTGGGSGGSGGSSTVLPATSIQNTDYTLVSADAGNVVPFSTAAICTIPANVFPVGTVLEIAQEGTGQVTIAGSTGVTLRTASGLKTSSQWSSVGLRQRAQNEWVITNAIN